MPFNNRVECPKCGSDRFGWTYMAEQGRLNPIEALRIRCDVCGWWTLMEPKDA